MAVEILKQCQKEILDWPEEVREDLADAIARLERGHVLSMPLSRPMPSIGKGVHELRLKDRSGVYRVIYFFSGASQICLLHAFKKTTQATSKQDIEIAKDRLKRTLK
jgi:phage-related protein